MNNELALLKAMLNKDFYDAHKGIRCPDGIFSKDNRKIKQTLDYAMTTYGRDLTLSELEALFFVQNGSMTTATKTVYRDIFVKMGREQPMNEDIAQEVLSKLFQQYVGEQVANIGFEYVNGTATTLEPLRRVLEYYGEDFIPNLRIEWDDMSIETLLKMNGLSAQWKFNIPSLSRRVEGISAGHLVMIAARPNVGKCLKKGTKVIMADGTLRKVEDLCVGDKLHGVNESHAPVTVTALGNGTDKHYRVTLRDGSYFECNASHILSLKRKKTEGKHKHGDIINVPIEEYITWPKSKKERYSAWRSVSVGTEVALPIHPYLLGAWLGDGTSSKPQYTISESALSTRIASIVSEVYPTLALKQAAYDDITWNVGGTDGKCDRYDNKNYFLCDLRNANVLNNKHIPEEYFRASVQERMALLEGLLDTDGYYDKGIYEITQVNTQLADGIVRLAHSLGMAARKVETTKASQNGTKGVYQRIRISPGLMPVNCVLDRKRHTPSANTKDTSMQSFTVTPIGDAEYYGFTLDGNNLFMVENNIVTHNTSFHASILAAAGGFAAQGAKCYVLCNEEASYRVGARYLTAAANMTMEEIKENPALAAHRYKPVSDNIHIKDCTGRDMAWVEQLIKAGKPDIVVLDMGDKFASKTSDKSDVYLKEAAIHARNIAKKYNCAILWLSQLSAEAEGKVMVNMSMMEGSRTGKAAEADLMLLLSKNPLVEGTTEEDGQRHINIAKNKLSGWHGIVHCELDGERAIFNA